MKEILGTKIGMTRIFEPTGESIPVTVIEAGPCPVIQKRTGGKEGRDVYQVGFGKRKTQRITKPMAGQFAKIGVEPTHHIRDIRLDGVELEAGATVTVEQFKEGDRVDVSGISRGLGFAGGMKRHNFNGANKTHGQSDRWRAPGSVGSSSYPSRVFKGQRMAGRMGRDKVTVMNLTVVKIIENQNLLLIRGAVPGHKGSLVTVRTTNRGRK